MRPFLSISFAFLLMISYISYRSCFGFIKSIGGGFTHFTFNKPVVDARRLFSSKFEEYIFRKPLIKSESNDKVKVMKAIISNKKKRDSLSLVALEGHRQVIDAVLFGLVGCNFLVTEKAFESVLKDDLLEALRKSSDAGAQVDLVSETVFRSISETVNGQGVVASFKKPVGITELPFVAGRSPVVVILDRLADPGNVGTIIRTAYGLGADAIIIADGCDLWNPKVIRSSMGMCLRIPVIESAWTDVPSLLMALRDRIIASADPSFSTLTSAKPEPTLGSPQGPPVSPIPRSPSLNIFLADASPEAITYHSADLTGGCVFVIGSEATGIGPQARALSSMGARPMCIPMVRELESLNAAVAAAILLGEAARQRGSGG